MESGWDGAAQPSPRRGEMTPYGWVSHRPNPWLEAMQADYQRRRAEIARLEALQSFDRLVQRCIIFAQKRVGAVLDRTVVGTRRHQVCDLSP